MQLRTLVFTTALAVAVAFAPIANAAECTNTELLQMDTLDGDPVLEKACPDSVGDTDIFDFDKFDTKDWAKPSPCKDVACLAFLKTQATKVSNCAVGTLNLNTVFEKKLTLCIDIAGGALTAAEISTRVGALTSVAGFDNLVDKAKSARSGAATMGVAGGAVFVAATLTALVAV